MMEESQALQYAKILYGRSGFCKHEDEFRQINQPYGTDVEVTTCGVCNKEFGRKIVKFK